jgi:hypothetical protein
VLASIEHAPDSRAHCKSIGEDHAAPLCNRSAAIHPFGIRSAHEDSKRRCVRMVAECQVLGGFCLWAPAAGRKEPGLFDALLNQLRNAPGQLCACECRARIQRWRAWLSTEALKHGVCVVESLSPAFRRGWPRRRESLFNRDGDGCSMLPRFGGQIGSGGFRRFGRGRCGRCFDGPAADGGSAAV